VLPINIDELLHGNTVEWDRIELKKGQGDKDNIQNINSLKDIDSYLRSLGDQKRSKDTNLIINEIDNNKFILGQ